VPNVLVDTSARSASVSFLGRSYAQPFGIAPMGVAGLMGYDCERAMARAAAAAGIPFVLSGASLTPMEAIREVAPEAWFQIYVTPDRDQMAPLIERVRTAGFDTLVVTVDFPVPGNREHYVRNGFEMPLRPSLGLAWQGLSHPRWLVAVFLRNLLAFGWPHFENTAAALRSPVIARDVVLNRGRRDRMTWDDIAWIRSRWGGKLIIKGILVRSDAKRAERVGADAIVVSNHGGRQLDRAVAPLDALPHIVEECPNLPVVLDGGVTRGTDVVTALSLGARLVLVGRPFLYAAAAGGRTSVERGIQLLTDEIDRDMAMLGRSSPADIDRTAVMERP
jgi:L-lactate dehydrogenase (cytochrome)